MAEIVEEYVEYEEVIEEEEEEELEEIIDEVSVLFRFISVWMFISELIQ